MAKIIAQVLTKYGSLSIQADDALDFQAIVRGLGGVRVPNSQPYVTIGGTTGINSIPATYTIVGDK